MSIESGTRAIPGGVYYLLHMSFVKFPLTGLPGEAAEITYAFNLLEFTIHVLNDNKYKK